jgi:8-oxo-dGTP pyrophosphatase MutT (NUDIX family)
VVFRILEGEEQVLLIRRAERKDDPWSGQIAFPGGRVNGTDKTFEETARRETAEEVGVDLSTSADFLGYMHEVKARTRDIVVVPSVFKLRTSVDVTVSREVASYEWVPLRKLARKESRSEYLHRLGEKEVAFPSLIHNDLVVWGLTERILSAIVGGRAEPGDDRVLGDVGRY